MKNSGTLQVTAPGEREIVMSREFDAPRSLVYDAWTKPERIRRWLGVRNGWTFTICDVDLRIGGKYRFVWRGPDGKEMAMGGVYREIVRPERIVATEAFDVPWYPGEAIDTTEWVERDGRTTVTTTILYATREARDAVLRSGMEQGVAESYDVLAELLASKA